MLTNGSAVRLARRASRRQVGQRLLDYPRAQRHDESCVLRDVDELAGHQRVPVRARPAYEGLKAGDVSGVKRHDGLVDQSEGRVADRLLQRGPYLKPPDHTAAEGRRVALPAVLARSLGRVQG